MFGKTFLKEIVWFLRTTSWFILGAYPIVAFGLLIIGRQIQGETLGDRVVILLGFLFIVFAVSVFLFGATVFGCISFIKGISAKGKDELRFVSPAKYVFAKLLAFELFTITGFVLIAAPVLIVTWKLFEGKWAPGLSLIAYAIIMFPFMRFAVTSIVASIKSRRAGLIVFACLAALMMGWFVGLSGLFEISLFTAPSIVEAQVNWISEFVFLAFGAIYDIVAFIITTIALKKRGAFIHENHHSDPLP